jgi:hypothetical protein
MTADRSSQRGVDVEGFAGDALTFSGAGDVMQRAHVVQTVGELHQQHPHILGYGQNELPQVFGLPLVVGGRFQAGKLGDALHQFADLLAEQPVDVGARHFGIFDDVVQQGRHDGGGVETVVGENTRDLDGMSEIGIPRRAFLRAVHAHGVDIGAIQQRFVGAGVVGPHTIDEFVLPKEPAALSARLGFGDQRRGLPRGRGPAGQADGDGDGRRRVN